jgi:hypothetical protein
MKLFSRPGGHFYKDNYTRLFPSVTTILHLIPNPGLEAWKARTQNWRKISAAACVAGTQIHNEIEHYLGGQHIQVKYKEQLHGFQTWQQEVGFRCAATELKVASRKGYAGSLDLLGWIEDKHYIIDLKTSKQLYPEMLLQLSAYKYAFLETSAIKEIEIGVLRIDKTKEGVEWHPYTEEEYKEGIAEFLSLCVEWHETHDTQREFQKRFVLED